MLIQLLIWIFNWTHINCFILQNFHDMNLKDNAFYKITQSLKDDLEMINGENSIDYTLEEKLFALNKIAGHEYEKNADSGSKYKEWFKGTEPTLIYYTAFNTFSPLTKHLLHKRYAFENATDYGYKYVLKRYREETANDKTSKEKDHVNDRDKNLLTDYSKTRFKYSFKKLFTFNTRTKNCTKVELTQIGLKAFYCLWEDYRKDRQPSRVIVTRLWRVIKVWFMVYLAVAVPSWFTKGWCCCCLCCQFFKPRLTIEEAKKYLLLNPPGVFKNNNGEIIYEPTENEKESYEEVEHLIRTI